MKAKRYKEDYVLTDVPGARTRGVVYRGAIFVLTPKRSPKREALKRVPAACLCLLGALGLLRFGGEAARRGTVLLPAILALFPCAYWLMGLAALFRTPNRMTRLQREQGAGRALRSAVGCALCLAVSTVAALVYGARTGDFVALGFCLLALASAAFGVAQGRELLCAIAEEKRAADD